MEFEQYLERDIITFLDSKMEKKDSTNIDREEEYGIYLLRDYLKELSYALDNDELTRAKKLFDELKKNYVGIPKGSLQRKKMYTLLEKMYEKIQNYVRIKEGKIEVIKQGDSEVLKDKIETFEGLPNAANKDKFDISKMTVSEPTNRSMLPLGLGDSVPKTSMKNDAEKNISSVESHIVDSAIKQSKSKDKYYEEKTEISEDEEKEEINQNVFTRSKPDSHKNKAKGDIEGLKWDTYKKYDKDSDSIINVDKILSGNSEMEGINLNIDLEDTEANPIDKTIAQIEVLKMHLIERLLKDLSKKLDKSNDEQNNKIEELRFELVKKMSDELDKRFGPKSYNFVKKSEQLRGEILDQVYHEAQHIVTSKDNPIVSNENNAAVENHQAENPKVESNIATNNGSMLTAKHSGEELRVVYEQAIYYMFENKYNEAAQLFRKIIDIQPKNKAAKIRLQECIDRHPELYVNMDTNYNDKLKAETDDFKNGMRKEIDASTKDFGSTEKLESYGKHSLKHKHNSKEIQNMYEEAMYTLFQSNYNEAARIFQEILRIRPTYKAAKIRLQECMEARGNA